MQCVAFLGLLHKSSLKPNLRHRLSHDEALHVARSSCFARCITETLSKTELNRCVYYLGCADDGSVYTMGLNDSGQLGHSSGAEYVPVSHSENQLK